MVFICDNNSGGIGNIRNYIHTCLRYALEAGATGITMPKIRRRDDHDLANIWTDYLPFTYMFDEQHFRHAFGTYCPHIRIYDDVADIPGVGANESAVEHITPKDFGNQDECHPWDQNRHAQRFGDKFRRWLRETGPAPARPPPSTNHARAVRFNWGVLWDWEVWRDGPEFAATFGHVLKFNDRLLRLGLAVLANMREVAREQQAEGPAAAGFIGVHLRTESDAGSSWPSFDDQLGVFRERVSSSSSSSSSGGSFRAAYLATGNATESRRFADEARAGLPGIRVVGKNDLLRGGDLEELDSLSFDQQGIVDSVVLLAADFFVGTMPSSFSVYMAMKRHLRTGGLHTRPFRVGSDGDGLSYVGGDYEKYWENWLFMWDGMWP